MLPKLNFGEGCNVVFHFRQMQSTLTYGRMLAWSGYEGI